MYSRARPTHRTPLSTRTTPGFNRALMNDDVGIGRRTTRRAAAPVPKRSRKKGGGGDIRRQRFAGPVRKFVQVMRAPGPNITFKVETWIPVDEFTDEERAEHEERLRREREEQRQRESLEQQQLEQQNEQSISEELVNQKEKTKSKEVMVSNSDEMDTTPAFESQQIPSTANAEDPSHDNEGYLGEPDPSEGFPEDEDDINGSDNFDLDFEIQDDASDVQSQPNEETIRFHDYDGETNAAFTDIADSKARKPEGPLADMNLGSERSVSPAASEKELVASDEVEKTKTSGTLKETMVIDTSPSPLENMGANKNLAETSPEGQPPAKKARHEPVMSSLESSRLAEIGANSLLARSVHLPETSEAETPNTTNVAESNDASPSLQTISVPEVSTVIPESLATVPASDPPAATTVRESVALVPAPTPIMAASIAPLGLAEIPSVNESSVLLVAPPGTELDVWDSLPRRVSTPDAHAIAGAFSAPESDAAEASQTNPESNP